MKHTYRHWLLKYKYVIAITSFAIVITFVGDHSLVRRYSQQQEIEELRSEINQRKQTYKKDKVELEKIHNNPEAVKRVAHERYYMKTEDEDIFVIPD